MNIYNNNGSDIHNDNDKIQTTGHRRNLAYDRSGKRRRLDWWERQERRVSQNAAYYQRMKTQRQNTLNNPQANNGDNEIRRHEGDHIINCDEKYDSDIGSIRNDDEDADTDTDTDEDEDKAQNKFSNQSSSSRKRKRVSDTITDIDRFRPHITINVSAQAAEFLRSTSVTRATSVTSAPTAVVVAAPAQASVRGSPAPSALPPLTGAVLPQAMMQAQISALSTNQASTDIPPSLLSTLPETEQDNDLEGEDIGKISFMQDQINDLTKALAELNDFVRRMTELFNYYPKQSEIS